MSKIPKQIKETPRTERIRKGLQSVAWNTPYAPFSVIEKFHKRSFYGVYERPTAVQRLVYLIERLIEGELK